MGCVPQCWRSGWTVADHLVGGLHCAEASDLAAAFVLGALEPAEMDGVRQHLAGCPEAHAEFAELGSVVPALFETVELVEPPASLRKRILDAAEADAQRATDTQRVADVPRAPRRPAADTQRSGGWLPGLFGRPLWAGLGVAAALALVALGVWNVQLTNQNAALTAYRDGVVAVLDQAAEPGAQLAVLAVPEGPSGPSGLAAVSADGSKVSLVMRDLAPTAGTEVYEAWVISGDAAPVPIGGFKVDASGTATFLATGPAPAGETITVALTKEPAEGARTPTMPIIALGTAAAS
jgi:anti-sigma factor RsiW